MTNADDFTAHVARVRERFASTLNDKIADSFAALEKMSAGGSDTIEVVIIAHRRMHEMYGIAPTLGFNATGKAAGGARAAIREAAKVKRAPTPVEVATLKIELEKLREAANADLRNFSKRDCDVPALYR
jgi:hypothetical protein